MTINRLQNQMRMQALLAAGLVAKPRMGLVTSYDPVNYCAKVKIQPQDVETGWLPIASPWAGNGWGLFAPPPIGAQVSVLFQEGSVEVGFIIGSLYSDSDVPLAVPSEEFWLVHKSGAYAKFTNDGKISVHGTVEIDIGDLTKALKKLVTDSFVDLFNNHVHSTGSGDTGVPTETMGDNQLTTMLKAN